MEKTNEEVAKILEKNYGTVQTAEIEVFDNNVELDKKFQDELKELDKVLKTELDHNDKTELAIKADFAKRDEETKKVEAEVQKALEDKKANASKVYEVQMKAILEAYEKEVVTLNESIETVKTENAKLVKHVEEEYNKNVEASKKAIISINEKSEKDQATFASKIEDLQVKFDEKIELLKEKELTKIEKLNENSEKQIVAVKDTITQEQENYDNKLAQLQPVYEEELEEILENIESQKFEYEAKHESIRTSADQRIAVREKHLHRAMDENDQRSVKQHKKDIEKFRKEADKDLVLLRKGYTADTNEAQVYRKNFIKENLEKLSSIEEETLAQKESRLKEIEDVKITLTFDVNNTKLDYEKLQAEELDFQNKASNEIVNKQEEVLKQKDIDLDNEANTQNKLQFEFDRTNKVDVEKLSQTLEQKDKELREASVNRIKEDTIAKDVLDIELGTFNNEQEVAALELVKDLETLHKQERKENHKVEHKSLVGNKEEFLGFQSQIEPLYNNRAKAIFEYEAKELNNRFALKIAFLEKQLALIANDYELVVQKVNSVLEIERAPYDEVINSIAGTQKEELAELEESSIQEINILKAKIEPLDEKRDKKLIRQLEDKLAILNDKLSTQKQFKEEEIRKSVGIYDQALSNALSRNAQAIQDAENFHKSETETLLVAIDLLKTHQSAELDEAKLRLTQTEGNVQDFITRSASRNTTNTEDNQAYMEAKVAVEDSLIDQANQELEIAREQANNEYNGLLGDLSEQKQINLSEQDAKLHNEEAKFETLKQSIESRISQINADAALQVSNETSKGNDKTNSTSNIYNQKIKGNDDELAKQVSVFNSHLNEISKKVLDVSDTLESEKKRVSKESESSLKEGISAIGKKLSIEISNIE